MRNTMCPTSAIVPVLLFAGMAKALEMLFGRPAVRAPAPSQCRKERRSIDMLASPLQIWMEIRSLRGRGIHRQPPLAKALPTVQVAQRTQMTAGDGACRNSGRLGVSGLLYIRRNRQQV